MLEGQGTCRDALMDSKCSYNQGFYVINRANLEINTSTTARHLHSISALHLVLSTYLSISDGLFIQLATMCNDHQGSDALTGSCDTH